MPLTGSQFQQLQQALLSAFPSHTSLAQMVRFGLNENLDVIAGTGKLADVVFNLITWAEAQGNLWELVTEAQKTNHGNPVLKAFHISSLRPSSSGPVNKASYDERSVTDHSSISKAETDYLDRLQERHLAYTNKYTSLGGTALLAATTNIPYNRAVVIKPEYVLFNRSHVPQRSSRCFEDAVEEILKLQRCVVTGDPGAGKSTTLWKLASRLAEEVRDDPHKPIPVVVELGRWSKPDQSLLDFVAHEIAKIGDLSLAELLARQRLALLMDGLNEIPSGQRKNGLEGKDAEIRRFIQANPSLTIVLSCRKREYTDLGFDLIDIAPLDHARILNFLTQYLPQHGQSLFWILGGHPDLERVWSSFMKAGVTFQQFWEFSHFHMFSTLNITWSDRRIWEQHKPHAADLMNLARNPYMLWMLTEIYRLNNGELPQNRAELFTEFVTVLLAREKILGIEDRTGRAISTETSKTLLSGLENVAYEMQLGRSKSSKGGTSLERERTLALLSSEDLFDCAIRASILTDGDTVRFTHQLLQQYFAARRLKIEISRELLASNIWDNGCFYNNWSEVAVIAAGLYKEDCTPIVEWLGDINPELTAECIKFGGSDVRRETLERCGTLWRSRLSNPIVVPDPLERAGIGIALDVIGLDNRPGVGLRSDGLPDIAWCAVPAGDFDYGEGGKKSRRFLDRFCIAKFPITFNQFEAFVRDVEGYNNPRWWKGLDNEGLRQHANGPGIQQFKIGNHPRENVSWYDAMAFCKWLSDRMGVRITLPTKARWQKAARGPGEVDSYAHLFDQSKCNIDEGWPIGLTSTVGIYPNGASSYGAHDMYGNVWEWTLTECADIYPVMSRVVCGDSYDPINYYPGRSQPLDRSSDIGFRLCTPDTPSADIRVGKV